ncbi:MAG: segregation/condensation protein A [Candidatus Omnitrophota bacterium]
MSYKIKLNIFEGPLDLLLFLIKKEKIDIYDIPILKITDQYIEYLDLMKMLDLEIAGEFLVMAATLVHIKSKLLLPQEEDGLLEEEEDPREDLVRRLLEYKKYKEAALSLREMHEESKNIFMRKGEGGKGKIISAEGEEYFEASLFDLITAFKKVLGKVSKKAFHKVIKNRFTVRDKIHEIYHMFTKRSVVRFFSLFQDANDKDEMIVTFLAVLELVKMREIFIVQKEMFEEFEIIRNPDLVRVGDGV